MTDTEIVTRDVNIAFSNLHSIDRTLQEPDWYRQVIIGILLLTIRMHGELTSGYEVKSAGRLCWSVRTLHELLLWMKFVTDSRENAHRFYKERFIDATVLARNYRKAIRAADAKSPLLPEVEAVVAENEQKVLDQGLSMGQPFLRVSDIVKAAGTEKLHTALNTFLSKMLHATAASILSPTVDEGYLQFLLQTGNNYTRVVIDHLRKQVTILGGPDILAE